MGVLSDLVVAPRSDAESICADSLSGKWPREDVKGLDEVKLGTLYALLTRSKADLDMQLLAGGDEGPWVTEIGAPLVAALVKVTAATRKSVAAQWLKTEELVLDQWDLERAESVIDTLVELAKQAHAEKVALLLWMSL
jgi:hypothetical protein